ncbi:MAG: hypothetical protein FJ284_07945 [Planctomycetes bacterium]|nr:hypothetical protein [Planctomycetota bacterium]
MSPMSPRLLRPKASGVFFPSQLANLEMWLDASKTSSVTLNGSTVSEWRDVRSTSSYLVSNSAAGQQPAWVASSRNGLSGINFGVGQNLFTPVSPAFNFSQPTTYFIVFQAPTSSGAWALFDGITTRQHVFGNNETQLTMFAGSSATAATIVGSTFYAVVLIYNGTSSSRRLNTRTAITVNPGTNAINQLRIGSSSGVRGDVNEFGVLSRAVTDAEATSLLTYLGKKWAITIT